MIIRLLKHLNKKILESPLLFAVLGFSIIWMFNYYPFFIHFFAPIIAPDTADYFVISGYWLTDQADLIKDELIDLPMGYPYLLFLVWKLGGGIYEAVFIQILILYASFAYLQFIIFKFYKNWGWLSFILLILYLLDTVLLRFSIAVLTEGVYTAAIAFLIAQLLRYLKGSENRLGLAIAIALPVFIRSNGIVFVLLPLFFFIIDIVYKQKTHRGILLNWMAVTLFFIGFSFYHTGYVNYGNLSRVESSIKKVLGLKKVDKNSPIKEHGNSSVEINKLDNFKKLLVPLEIPKKPIYNLDLINIINHDYISKMVVNRSLYSNNRLNVPDFYKPLFFKGFINKSQQEYEGMISELNLNNEQGYLIKIRLKFSKLIQLLRRNLIFYYLSLVIYVYLILLLFKNIFQKVKLEGEFLILFLVYSIHYCSLVLISIEHGNLIYRYTLVSEVALAVCFPLGVKFIIGKIPILYKEKLFTLNKG